MEKLTFKFISDRKMKRWYIQKQRVLRGKVGPRPVELEREPCSGLVCYKYTYIVNVKVSGEFGRGHVLACYSNYSAAKCIHDITQRALLCNYCSGRV